MKNIFGIFWLFFEIIFDIFDLGKSIVALKTLISFQRKFWKPVFRFQTPFFIFHFSWIFHDFIPYILKNFQIPESHENPKIQVKPKMDSGIFAVFWRKKKDSSRKIDAEGATESIRSEKSYVFISKLCFCFHVDPGKFYLRPADIPICDKNEKNVDRVLPFSNNIW